MDLEETTYTVLEGCDAKAMLDLCSGNDNRITNHIDDAQFFDKVVLPIDIARAKAARKELEEKKKARVTEESSDFSWDSSKKADSAKVKGVVGDSGPSSPTKKSTAGDASAFCPTK
jgi:hypothetical protein